MTIPSDVKDVVREQYGLAALRVNAGQRGCCGSGPSAVDCCDPITSNLYDAAQAAEVPDAALLASLGLRQPDGARRAAARRDRARPRLRRRHRRAALGAARGADRQGLRPRHDGRDARRSPTRTSAKAGVANVEFLKGEIEHIPLPDDSVDVIISNCVINLSADKDRVLREAFRVLKPGGRFAVSDVVVRGEVPGDHPPEHGAVGRLRRRRAVGGRVQDKLAAAGFGRRRTRADARLRNRRCADVPRRGGPRRRRHRAEVDGKFVSAFIRAVKPESCCAPGCCSGPDRPR